MGLQAARSFSAWLEPNIDWTGVGETLDQAFQIDEGGLIPQKQYSFYVRSMGIYTLGNLEWASRLSVLTNQFEVTNKSNPD